MLTLTRRPNEGVRIFTIAGQIDVVVRVAKPGRMRLGFVLPEHVEVARHEILDEFVQTKTPHEHYDVPCPRCHWLHDATMYRFTTPVDGFTHHYVCPDTMDPVWVRVEDGTIHQLR